MKKFYFVFCFLLSAAGCASLPDKNPYTDENTVYKIEAVNVKFSSVCSVGDYDSEDEIRRQFNENIRQAFCASLPCAAAENNGEINTVAVTFDVFYRRVLMGEAFNCPSEAYGNGLFKYGVKAVKKVKNENGKKRTSDRRRFGFGQRKLYQQRTGRQFHDDFSTMVVFRRQRRRTAGNKIHFRRVGEKTVEKLR